MRGENGWHAGTPDVGPADLARIRQSMERLREASPPSTADDGTPHFPDLESWVTGFFVLTFGRPEAEAWWCDHWWDHPEAVLRLDALWRSWEAAVRDPLRGMALWIRDHLDPNLAVLLSPAGPFAPCRDGVHTEPPVLPVAATPPGWWSPSPHWWDVLVGDDP